MSGFEGVIVINLLRRKDRLDGFLKNFRNSDLRQTPLYHLQAIDSSHFVRDDVLRKTVTPRAYEELQNKAGRMGRLPTLGAIGCYMSHMKAWRYIVQHGSATGNMHGLYLICEDDADIPNTFVAKAKEAYAHFKQLLPGAPLICKYHAWMFEGEAKAIGPNLFLPGRYWSTTAYAISAYDALHLLSLSWLPIDVQIDKRENELRDAGKVVVGVCPLINARLEAGTDVQA